MFVMSDEKPGSGGRSSARVVLLLIAAAVAAGLTYRLWPRQGATSDAALPPAVTARPVPVVTELARTGDIPVYIDGLGAVTPLATLTMRSHVEGQLMARPFQEGQVVHAGDLLAEIDPRPFQVQLQQAQGQLAKDQALLANGLVDLERYRKLWAQDSIPKQQLDTQEALVRQYQASLETDKGQVDASMFPLTSSHLTEPNRCQPRLRLLDTC